MKAYFQNRFARIYPLYFFSLALAFPLFLYFESKTNPHYLSTVIEVGISSVFMIQSWNYSWLLHLNPPTWSLAVEALLYLIFPLLLAFLQSKNKLFLISAQVVIYVASMVFFFNLINNLTQGQVNIPYMHIPTFTLGIIAGLLLGKKEMNFLKFQSSIKSSLIFGLVIVSIFIFLIFGKNNEDMLNLGLLSPFYIFIFLLLANNSNLLSAKILVRLGEISYAIYLLHQPLRSYLSLLFKYVDINNYYLQFGIYLVVLIALSNYVYLYLELPLHKKLKYKFAKND